MSEYDDATDGDRIAARYDDWYGDLPYGGPVERTVNVLTDLAGDGAALELGIGTGRVALPLAASGVEVHGIDASEWMIARLKEKPGGRAIAVTMGSSADFDLGREFDLIYVVFNTFFALLSQEEQVSAFRAVRRHLTGRGVFVMEAFVPELTRLTGGQQVGAVEVGVDQVRLDVLRLEAATQRVDAQHVVLRHGDVHLYPVRLRFAYPSELDLMAQLVGMRLRERWNDWDRSPYSGSGPKHVSVWELGGSPTVSG